MAEVEKQVVSGDVLEVNASAHSVKIRDKAKEIELKIDDDTTITVNGFYKAFSDLSAGQKFRKIYFAERSGGNVATVIHAIDEKLLERQKKDKGTTEKGERKPAI